MPNVAKVVILAEDDLAAILNMGRVAANEGLDTERDAKFVLRMCQLFGVEPPEWATNWPQ